MEWIPRLDIYRARHSFKIGLAATLCVFFNNILHLNFAFFSLVSAFVILHCYPIATLGKALERVFGILFWACIAILTIRYVHIWAAYTLIFVALLLITTYLFASGVFPYANILGGIIGAIILAYGAKAPHSGIDIGIYAIQAAALGIAVALIIQNSIFRFNSHRKLSRDLANALRALSNKASFFKLSNLAALSSLLTQCKADITAKHESYEDFNKTIIDIKNMYLISSRAHKSIATLHSNFAKLFIHDIDKALASINEKLNTISDHIEQNQKITLTNYPTDSVSQKLKLTLEELRNAESTKQYNIEDVIATVDTINSIEIMNQQLTLLIEDYNRAITNNQTIKKLPKTKKNLRISYNKEHLRLAIKISLTIGILCILYLFDNFPGGIQSVITAAVIAAQPNIGASIQKKAQRILGIVIGAVIGLLLAWFITKVPIFPIFLLMIFIVYSTCSYLGLENPHYNYICLQAGVIIALIIAYNNGPFIDLHIAIERILGVFMGSLIALVIVHFIWPVHPFKLVTKPLRSSLTHIKKLFNSLYPQQQVKFQNISKKLESEIININTIMLSLYYDTPSKNIAPSLSDIITTINQIYINLRVLGTVSSTNKLSIKVVKSLHTQISQYLSSLGTCNSNTSLLLEKLNDITKTIREHNLSHQLATDKVLDYASTVVLIKNLLYNMDQLNKEINILLQQKKIPWRVITEN